MVHVDKSHSRPSVYPVNHGLVYHSLISTHTSNPGAERMPRYLGTHALHPRPGLLSRPFILRETLPVSVDQGPLVHASVIIPRVHQLWHGCDACYGGLGVGPRLAAGVDVI